ncbi:MAG: hypothetical protein LUC95_04180 [Lachnospiraceae bacterium]|nr:hypothetical protein [Lachnospiraceae bacterium]
MKDKGKIRVGIISAVLAVMVFIAILCIQVAEQKEITYVTVVSAKTQIAENTVLTASNLETLLELRQVPEEYVPGEALVSLDGLEGMTVVQVSEGSILTEAMLRPVSDFYEDYGELYWVSVSVDQLSNAVAGTLRTGDRVDLYCLESSGEEGVCTLLASHVRIERTFTKSGEEIDNADETSMAQLFVIPIERTFVSSFYEALLRGSLLIAESNE